jgi:hypothetical protein
VVGRLSMRRTWRALRLRYKPRRLSAWVIDRFVLAWGSPFGERLWAGKRTTDEVDGPSVSNHGGCNSHDCPPLDCGFVVLLGVALEARGPVVATAAPCPALDFQSHLPVRPSEVKAPHPLAETPLILSRRKARTDHRVQHLQLQMRTFDDLGLDGSDGHKGKEGADLRSGSCQSVRGISTLISQSRREHAPLTAEAHIERAALRSSFAGLLSREGVRSGHGLDTGLEPATEAWSPLLYQLS